jgi:uncharacterized membrane protein YczE
MPASMKAQRATAGHSAAIIQSSIGPISLGVVLCAVRLGTLLAQLAQQTAKAYRKAQLVNR